MKGKTVTKLTTLLLTVAILFTVLCSSAFAQGGTTTSTLPPAPTEGTAASGSTGSAQWQQLIMPMTIYISIIGMRNTIQEVSSGYVKMYGYAEANAMADRVGIDFELQQWNGSSWVAYKSAYYYEDITDQYNKTAYMTCASGHYYRVKTTNYAFLDPNYDAKILISSYIYVD